MKKMFPVVSRMKTIGLSVLMMSLLTVAVQAAPPLRMLVPVTVGHRTMIAPTDLQQVYGEEDSFCATQAVIGSGNYLQHQGSPRVLTILVNFQDVAFTVNDPVQAFTQYLMGDTQEDLGNKNNLNIASVRQYFNTCSGGQFVPQFDVIGPLTLPNDMAYYGGTQGNGSDDRFSDLCRDATELAKSHVDDWTIYDNDDDGLIELVCIIFAGFGQNQGGDSNTIWAKASVQNLKLNDDLHITRFNCCSELFHPQYPTYINGTGVFIHEFSHCLGLPDLYATKSIAYVNNQGMESYSIMDYGLYNRNSYAPAPYTAWEQSVMQWITPEDLSGKMADGSYHISDVAPLIEGGNAYKVVNPDNDRDYIVMENIQKRGLNTYANGHGLLVYHIDYQRESVNMGDSPNNNPGHPGVAVVPAGGLFINSYLRGTGKTYTTDEWKASMASSTFPGSSNVTTLNNQMQLPNYCFYDGDNHLSTNFQLTNITEQAETGLISFFISKEGTSAISDVEHVKSEPAAPYYDLQGRPLSTPLKPGLYISRGKKKVVNYILCK